MRRSSFTESMPSAARLALSLVLLFAGAPASFAAPPPDPAWSEVDKLVDEQKAQAALDKTLAILSAAKASKNSRRQTEALIRATQLRIGLHGYETAVRFLQDNERAARPADPEGRILLGLYYAHALETYWNAYSWEISNREAAGTAGKIGSGAAKSVDLKEWTAAQLGAEIGRAFDRAIAEAPALDKPVPEFFRAYMTANDYPPQIRPSLRDVIVYEAAEHLRNSSRWTPAQSNNVYKVGLARLAAAPPETRLSAADESQHPLVRVASWLGGHRAAHERAGRAEAALEARYRLFELFHEAAQQNDDRASLIEALRKAQARGREHPWWARGQALLAQMIQQSPVPGRLIEARKEAQAGQRAHPQSPGGAMCRSIVETIELPDYQLEAMRSDLARKNSILIQYKNLRRLWFRAYPIDLEAEIASPQSFYRGMIPDDFSNRLSRGTLPKPAAEWQQDLEPTPDYALHRAFAVPPLSKPGFYVVVASARSRFEDVDNKISAAPLLVSSLALSFQKVKSDSIEARAWHADSGVPAAGVELKLFRQRLNEAVEVAVSRKTGPDGSAILSPSLGDAPARSGWVLFAKRGADLAYIDTSLRFHQPSRQASDNRQNTLIFSDRAIYRPGQKVLWKALAYEGSRAQGKFKAAVGASLEVGLYDPNSQLIEKKSLRLNKFGTGSGEFTIASGRPLGAWTLRATNGAGVFGIQVEEYKRPTFEAKFLDPKEPLRLNSPAKLLGEARYYFGQPVSLGKAKWRVTKQANLPWDWRWRSGRGWRSWRSDFHLSSTSPQTIASGTSPLSADGTFAVAFSPEADNRTSSPEADNRTSSPEADNRTSSPEADKRTSSPEADGITWIYRVEADVSDEGGETRTASRSFRLGFSAVEASVSQQEAFFDSGSATRLEVLRTNLDGVPQAGVGSYRIARLAQPPSSPLPADLPLGAASDALQPEDTAADPARFATVGDERRARWQTAFEWQAIVAAWLEEETIAKGALAHDASGKAAIELAKAPPPGAYRAIYETKDSFGRVYRASKDFLVLAKRPKISLPLLALPQKSSYRVGETARIAVHGGIPGQTLFVEKYRAGLRLSRTELKPGSNDSIIEMPITVEDRGGFSVVASSMRDFQWMSQTLEIGVPWDDKELKVAFETLRDRMRPGSKETVRISVKDHKGRPLGAGAAELLAYMYDRSLDLFASHDSPNPLTAYPGRATSLSTLISISSSPGRVIVGSFRSPPSAPSFSRDHLLFLDRYSRGGMGSRVLRSARLGHEGPQPLSLGVPMPSMVAPGGGDDEVRKKAASSDSALAEFGAAKPGEATASSERAVEIRSNFAETAFFFPHLALSSDGTASFEFLVPDSVTAWRAYAHAIAPDLRAGTASREAASVKDLMVRPYAPRFLREGDAATIKASIDNASGAPLQGEVSFDIEYAETGQSALAEFGLSPAQAKAKFSAPKGGSASVSFALRAPNKPNLYAFRVVGRAKGLSDGERRPFPVLPSRVRLAQSRFAALKGKDRKTLEFKGLASPDPTRVNERVAVTVDGQLFYGALQALPYLIDYPYECAEQTLNRFVSTGIVASIFDKYPEVARAAKAMSSRKAQLERFDADDANRRMALEETPWLELAQGGRPGVDLASDRLVNVLDERVAKAARGEALAKLRKMQLSGGEFPWFPGGQPDRYITLYVLMGLARALEFKVEAPKDMIAKAWASVRRWADADLREIMRRDCCAETIAMVSYALSAYPDPSWTGGAFDQAYSQKLLDYAFGRWKRLSPLVKGYLTLALMRAKRVDEARLVWASVMDSAKQSEELGTYWAPEDRSWLWYNDTVETQAFALRVQSELEPKSARNEGLVQWLFLNKKLNHWKSTKATAEAIYSLAGYLDKTGGLGAREEVSVDLGTTKTSFVFEPGKWNGGRNQIVIPGERIDPVRNSKIVVEKSTPGLAFASATWHFSTQASPKEGDGDFFSVARKYFLRSFNGKEWTLKPLAEGAVARVGDQIEVHLSLRAKHEAEYVHLRDPRGAGFEPEGLFSGYKQDLGISWYEEVRDSGSNFFFSSLPAGEYAFKYRVRANMAGEYRVGPATVQSIYAPEFNAHSAGGALKVVP